MRLWLGLLGSMVVSACGGAASNGVDPVEPEVLPGDCQYPGGAVEPMAVGVVLSAYSWPDARRLADSTEAALDLVHVPCATD